MSSDSRQATLFDMEQEERGAAPATPAVSVVRDGDAYRVNVRGEEVTLTDWSLLVLGRIGGKWSVEMGGKTFLMDDAEFDAFHAQLCKATPNTGDDEEEEEDDDEII